MILTETQAAIQEAVRAFAQEQIRPRSQAFEDAKGYPDGLFEEIAGLGLMGMVAPESAGGADADYVSYALALIELAAADGALSTIVSIQNSLLVGGLLKEGSEEQKARYLPDLISGKMGQPPGGFPLQVQRRILKDRPLVTGRPGESLLPADFPAAGDKVREILKHQPTNRDVVTWLLYPKVYEEFIAHVQKNSDTSDIPTPAFFYGLAPGEEVSVDIELGKRLIVKFLSVSEPHPNGSRTIFFELNGQPRDVTVIDKSLEPKASANLKADTANPKHVGASMPGMISTIAVQAGDSVTKGQKLLSLEAMKMETNIAADRDGKIGQVLIKRGTQVAAGDLLVTFE